MEGLLLRWAVGFYLTTVVRSLQSQLGRDWGVQGEGASHLSKPQSLHSCNLVRLLGESAGRKAHCKGDPTGSGSVPPFLFQIILRDLTKLFGLWEGKQVSLALPLHNRQGHFSSWLSPSAVV